MSGWQGIPGLRHHLLLENQSRQLNRLELPVTDARFAILYEFAREASELRYNLA